MINEAGGGGALFDGAAARVIPSDVRCPTVCVANKPSVGRIDGRYVILVAEANANQLRWTRLSDDGPFRPARYLNFKLPPRASVRSPSNGWSGTGSDSARLSSQRTSRSSISTWTRSARRTTWRSAATRHPRSTTLTAMA